MTEPGNNPYSSHEIADETSAAAPNSVPSAAQLQPHTPTSNQAPTGQTWQAQAQPGQPYSGQTPPQSPYAAPPSPYAYAQQPQQPKKKWPWIVLACILAFLLGLGGCVGCATVGIVADSLHNRSDSVHSYDYDDQYGFGYNPDSIPDSDVYGGFTLSDIKDAAGDLPNQVEGNQASAGVYVVGRDIDAGQYFLQGDPSIESQFHIFTPEGSGTYSLSSSVAYTGNYFADLAEGDVIAFLPDVDDACMVPADDADFEPQTPYQSGLYRVGVDIPAGTYSVTVSSTAPQNASQDYAAYVMQDLDFDEDSITDSVYLLRGSTQTVTVQDGDWLELFGTVATPSL